MSRPVLATINGKAVHANDLLYSTWHGRSFFATDVWVDGDDDVFFIVPGGHVSINSVALYNENSPVREKAGLDALAWSQEK